MPTEPRRVFGMYTTDLDYALALGLPIAPVQAIRNGSVGLPDFFPQEELGDVEFFVNYPEYNWERIASIDADLILNGLGYDGGPDVERLNEIAPTYTFNGFGGDWRDDFTAMGEAFGREAEAATFLEQLDERTDELRAIVPEGLTVAFGWYNPDGGGGFVGPQLDSLQGVIFDDLGIAVPALVTEPWTEIAQEQMLEMTDADLFIVAVETAEDADATLAAVREDPVWSALPAVQAGNLVAMNNELSYASPSAHLQFLDELADVLDTHDLGDR